MSYIDPLAPLSPLRRQSPLPTMSEDFPTSPATAAREARIARLSGNESSTEETFPDEPSMEQSKKPTRRTRSKQRGDAPTTTRKRSEQRSEPESPGSSHGSSRASSRKRRPSTGLDESKQKGKVDNVAVTKERRSKLAASSSHSTSPMRPSRSGSPDAKSSSHPPSRSTDTKESKSFDSTTTPDNGVEVVAVGEVGSTRIQSYKMTKRPSRGLNTQVQRDPSEVVQDDDLARSQKDELSRSYRQAIRRRSRSTNDGSDDGNVGNVGNVKIEAISSHAAKANVVAVEDATASMEMGADTGSVSSVGYPSVWIRLPNTSFGISMGLAGQAIMWKIAGGVDFLRTQLNTELLNVGFWVSSLTIGVLLFTAYALKAWFYYPLVRDEYRDGSRVHFFNMPHLIMMMLTIGVPASPNSMSFMSGSHVGEQIIWGIGFVVQVFFTQHIYESWLFSDRHNISCARPQFLLSTVGWFFLASLGAQAQIEQEWGLALPTFCFGFGMMLYLMVAIAIFNGIHAAPKAKGSPALFLLVAPPAVGVVAWDLISNGGPGNFADMSALLLGYCLGLFILLVKLGPKILQPPPSLGSYWAYVFPMSALAGALIRYAWAVQTASAEILAIVFVALSMFALFAVFIRMTLHIYRVWTGQTEWGDPLLSPERLASVSAIMYSELIPDIETA